MRNKNSKNTENKLSNNNLIYIYIYYIYVININTFLNYYLFQRKNIK